MKLSLSQNDRLHPLIENEQYISKNIKSILSTFNKNQGKGLLLLANTKPDDNWSANLYFWKEFASYYVNLLCHKKVQQNTEILPISLPTNFYFDNFLQQNKSIVNKEGYKPETLKHAWGILNKFIIAEVNKDNLNNFFTMHLSNWQQVGQVFFHLAENKNDAEYPFAFMVTYASNLNNQANLINTPLNKALQENSTPEHKSTLINLLQPIYNIAKKISWVQKLLDSQEIYHPLRWSIKQAYSLLKSSQELQDNGIIVRLPDWWAKNKKPQVQISIGNENNKELDLKKILDFNVDIIYDNNNLTDDEIETILNTDSNLVCFRGNWIEVNPEKLKNIIEQWQIAKKNSNNGISFIEGMRMIAGFKQDINVLNNDFDADKESSWESFIAGPWLADTLKKLHDPTNLHNYTPKNLTNTKLRHYQQTGVNWLYFLTNLGLGACLADDMGLGKSIQIIALLLLTKEANIHPEKCSLLVLPASLLTNWKNELTKFAPSLNIFFLHPSATPAAELELIYQNPEKLHNYDLVLTTYGTVWRQAWIIDQHWNYLILDEAQAIKSPTSKQTKAIKNLNSKARIALTGTPIENSLSDLWSLFDFLSPGLLGSYNSFQALLKKIQKNTDVTYAPLRKLVQPYILRRLKNDKKIISDLPDKIEVNNYCGLSKLQASLYKKLIKELSAALADKKISTIQRKGLVLNYLLKFKQICNHPSQILADNNYDPKHSGKFACLQALCDEIKQKQEKVLIFTQFKTITKPLALFLETIFEKPGLILHGSTAIKKRQELVDSFQSKDGPPFFVLSLKAGGTGLNLTAASHVIHFDRWWNPAVENQATDRAFRIGQKSNVIVHKFICSGTIEENINKIITRKTKLANDILTSNNPIKLTELTNQEILNLVALDINKIQI